MSTLLRRRPPAAPHRPRDRHPRIDPIPRRPRLQVPLSERRRSSRERRGRPLRARASASAWRPPPAPCTLHRARTRPTRRSSGLRPRARGGAPACCRRRRSGRARARRGGARSTSWLARGLAHVLRAPEVLGALDARRIVKVGRGVWRRHNGRGVLGGASDESDEDNRERASLHGVASARRTRSPPEPTRAPPTPASESSAATCLTTTSPAASK